MKTFRKMKNIVRFPNITPSPLISRKEKNPMSQQTILNNKKKKKKEGGVFFPRSNKQNNNLFLHAQLRLVFSPVGT